MIKSPFPGMDPYLEAHWRDVHHRFLTYACDDLQGHLPESLRARLEERVFIEPDDGEGRSIYPDVRVVERPQYGEPSTPSSAVAVLSESVELKLKNQTATEGFIEIIDVGSGNKVITAIELLSASNKRSSLGRELYLKKQQEYRDGDVSLVEIDLLREGERVLSLHSAQIPASHRTAYLVCVTRSWKPDSYELYAAPLRQRLPTIGVPLRENDPIAPLDWQSIIDRCYQNGRYDDANYACDPEPPLKDDDAKWADELLRGCEKR